MLNQRLASSIYHVYGLQAICSFLNQKVSKDNMLKNYYYCKIIFCNMFLFVRLHHTGNCNAAKRLHINTLIDPRKTDFDNTVEYEECGQNVDKSTERDSSNHNYIVLTLTLEAGSKQLDKQVHQKKQAQLRQLFLSYFA